MPYIGIMPFFEKLHSTVNEKQIKDHLGEMVRGTVEETLNGMLEQEADYLVGASRYERAERRKDTREGH